MNHLGQLCLVELEIAKAEAEGTRRRLSPSAERGCPPLSYTSPTLQGRPSVFISVPRMEAAGSNCILTNRLLYRLQDTLEYVA